jgi:quinol monooxygenase YgiN
VLVVNRFRVAEEDSADFRAAAQQALEVLAQQRGYLGGEVGRNVDDTSLWLIQTSWEGPGAYRRALSAYDVKVRAWHLLGRALDEPSAYEVVRPGEPLNRPGPRGG